MTQFDDEHVESAMSNEDTTPRVPGPVETQVRHDIEAIGGEEVGFRGSLTEIALALARALDRADAGEDLSKVAAVSLQLRQTLASMASVGTDAETLKKFMEWMRTPE